VVVVGCLLVAVIALGFALVRSARRRSRRRVALDPAAIRARDAALTFDARVARPDADAADALAEFLAAHLRCAAAAVISPDLPARLSAAGVSPALAARAAATLESLVAARYGGGDAVGIADVSALVRELEAALRPTANGPRP
jgi:hypothetical protein